MNWFTQDLWNISPPKKSSKKTSSKTFWLFFFLPCAVFIFSYVGSDKKTLCRLHFKNFQPFPTCHLVFRFDFFILINSNAELRHFKVQHTFISPSPLVKTGPHVRQQLCVINSLTACCGLIAIQAKIYVWLVGYFIKYWKEFLQHCSTLQPVKHTAQQVDSKRKNQQQQ